MASKANQETSARKRLLSEPNDSDALYTLGLFYKKRGDYGQATTFLCQAVAANPKSATLYVALGHALLKSGKRPEAICTFRQALSIDACSAAAYAGAGEALLEQGEGALAIAMLLKAIAYKHDSSQYQAILANAYRATNALPQALAKAKYAIKLSPTNNSAYFSLVDIYYTMGKFDSGISILRKLLNKPRVDKETFRRSLQTIAIGLNALKRWKQALSTITLLLEREPGNSQAHFCKAWTLLLMGCFNEGWKEYEWRLKMPGVANRHQSHFILPMTEPMWQGEPLAGKTLLVHTEQGLGDAIMFIRFAPVLARLGARVVVACYPDLELILRTVPGIALVVPFGQSIPRYDFHVSICSVPSVIRPSVDSLAMDVPYITAPNRSASRFKLNRKADFRIGFHWSTKSLEPADHRNVPLSAFQPLFDIKSISFYSFQINDQASELKPYIDVNDNVHSLKLALKNFNDTAYWLGQMDLVLTIDTSIAHLAGALGAPVWLLLPANAEWRWLTHDENSPWFAKSPWYPTMRLFRARHFNAWAEVVESMRGEITKAFKPSVFTPNTGAELAA
jgi:tetratricopeptide (TPR) repeat protein